MSTSVVRARGYWFKSSRFEIEPGEDEEINPGLYGRQLANWLKNQLERCGYEVEDVINEDWGRCLMCQRDPFMLWVGCGSVDDPSFATAERLRPAKEEIVWHCFATAEVFFWKRFFRKIETVPVIEKLHRELGSILAAEPTITLVEEP